MQTYREPAMKSIRNYLPKREHNDKTEIIQARISSELKQELFRIAARNQWKASDVIRGAILKFIDDEKMKAS